MDSEAFEVDKKKSIANAAFMVFAEHGFRKTSMQLIANKAGMSRPALYLHFQSKEDIFGYLGLDFFTKVLARVDAVLAHSGNPEQVLQGVFDAFDPDAAMAFLLDAEHGNELMDVKSGSSHEAIDKIATNIRLALMQWLKDEADQGRIECADPIITGQTIMSSFYGIKKPLPTYAVYKARAAQLAKMFGKGLKL